MGTLVAIGEAPRIHGFALIGAVVFVAEDAESVRTAWDSMPEETDVVLLSPCAAEYLRERMNAPDAPLVAVMPEVADARV